MSSPRRGRPKSEKTKAEIELIKNYLNIRGIDISTRFKSNFRNQMMKDLNITDRNRMLHLINSIRRDGKLIGALATNRQIVQGSDKILKCVQDMGFIRSSQKETAACELIAQVLYNKCDDINLPMNGVGLYIGTPTPFCVSEHNNNNQLITDNLEVAIALKHSTNDPITFVIGNAVDPPKADRKAFWWRNISSISPNSEIHRRKVDKHTFGHHVETLAKRYPKRRVKVVLLTSGNWVGNEKAFKRGLDLNFQEPAQRLTSMYNNLHILAMTREHPGYGFDVRYLHAGKETVYWARKEVTDLVERCYYTMEERHYG